MAPGALVVRSVMLFAAARPLSATMRSPAVTLMVESGPSQVTPVSPIVPPATTRPSMITSLPPIRLMDVPASSVLSVEVAWM